MAAIYFIIGCILKLITAIFALIIYTSDALLGIVLSGALAVQDMDSVNIGWSVARDTINMFFVVFLLVIAFTTILRIEAYQYKQLLPKLILSILLVNFSRTICSVLIEFSNVLTSAFLNFAPGQETAAGIVSLMGMQSVWDIDSGISVTGITDLTMCLSMILITIYMGGLAIAFAGLTGMMITRTIALLVLIVLSPIAFGMNVLPVTSTYFKKWWDEFIKYLFYGPIAAFCIYLSAIVAADANTNDTTGFGAEAWDSALNHTPPTMPAAGLTQTEFVWEYALVVGLLFLGIAMIKEGGGMGAHIAMDFAKKGMMGGAKLAGFGLQRGAKWGRKKLGGQGLSEGSKKWRQSGGSVKKAFGAIGQGVGAVARATYLPAAWKAQAEKEYGEEDALGTAWARNKLNKAFAATKVASVDPTDYEYRARMGLVNQARDHYKTENPGGGWQYLVNKMNQSKDSAGESHYVEEALRELNPTRNLNEVIRLEAQDRAFGESMHTNKELIGKYDPAAVLDLLEKQFGKEEGRKMMMDMGEQGVAAGSWICKEYLMRDTNNNLIAPGEEYRDVDGSMKKYELESTEDNPNVANYADNWAGEFSKRDIGDRVDVFRGDFNALEYDAGGNENVVGAQKGYKKYIEKFGWGGQDAYRAVQRMSPNIKKALMDDKHFEDISGVIEKQLKSESKEIKARGISNLQFYYEIGEAAGMSDKVVSKIKQLTSDNDVKLSKPGAKGNDKFFDAIN
jgi:hypothetical protein